MTMSTLDVVTYDESSCMQLDKTEVNSIAIVFRSWSCSFPPVEAMDQPTVRNSQTLRVALLSLMQLMKVSNINSGGESKLHFVLSHDHSSATFCDSVKLQERGAFDCT